MLPTELEKLHAALIAIIGAKPLDPFGDKDDRGILFRYLKEKRTFSIPELQQDLGVSYYTLRRAIDVFLDEGYVHLTEGVTYEVAKELYREDATQDPEADSRIAYLRARREEILRRLREDAARETREEEEDDDDDENNVVEAVEEDEGGMSEDDPSETDETEEIEEIEEIDATDETDKDWGIEGIDDEEDRPHEYLAPTYRNALKTVIRSKIVSCYILQRRLGIGYAHAANLIGWMEQMNFITAPDPTTGRRKLCITEEEFVARFGPFDD